MRVITLDGWREKTHFRGKNSSIVRSIKYNEGNDLQRNRAEMQNKTKTEKDGEMNIKRAQRNTECTYE